MEKLKQDRVWAPDPIDGYVLGYITDFNGEALEIEQAEQPGKTVTAFYDEVFPALEEVLDKNVEDNCSLVYLNEATLLQNVRLRYRKELIYTYVANILIAVNPYKDISDLYSKSTAHKYKGKSLGVLPPHVFAIADKIYRDMRTNKTSQSIIVSGESGAGKTESTKHVLRYLMESYGASSGLIEKRIVEANPMLESLGNSRTLRNVNSSRFGKFVEIHFDGQFQVVGGHVSHYLLERSRICSQTDGECNYHIFYHLLAGAPDDMRQALMINEKEIYGYLNPLSRRFSKTDKDREGYQSLVSSMDCIGMTGHEKDDLFRVVAAVLHLGNILFEEDGSDRKGGSMVRIDCETSLRAVANLLGIDSEDLRRCLTYRIMTTTKKGAIGTVINVPLKPEQAVSARDALAKATYVRMFDWVIKRVNECFPFSVSKYYIGILDIAGFEYYQINTFEQFCINYCNEKLQQLFNERVFKEEQELYKKEDLGIASTRYIDNQDCIDLIEYKGSGIIDLLDEECRVPRGSNENFTFLVHSNHNNHFRLLSPRQSKLSQHKSLRDEEAFLIRHFAGAVCYKTTGFLDKNNDALHGSLEQLMGTSSHLFVKSLFVAAADSLENPAGSYAKKLVLDSFSSKFRAQLNKLMTKLRKTETSFIRCIKPNLEMVPGKFIGGQVLSQLQCGGMVAVLKLMEGGYPSRTQFTDLYNMYQSFLPVKLARLDPRTFCEALFRAVGVKSSEFKFGNNKVFFKAGKFAEFDQLMHSSPENLRAMVAKVEHWLIRKQWKKIIYGAISVQKLSRKIRYRDDNAVIVQSYVRMCLARKKHKPRYQGMHELKHLKAMVTNLRVLASGLKTDKDKVLMKVSDLENDLEKEISKIKMSVMTREKIEEVFARLMNGVGSLTTEIHSRQESEKVEEEEREIMKKLREMQHIERRKREEEMLRRTTVEAEMKKERKRKQEETYQQQIDAEIHKLGLAKRQQVETDRQLGLRIQREDAEEEMRQLQNIEQERRDFELALRLATTETQSQNVINDVMKHKEREHKKNIPVIHKPPADPIASKIQAVIKQYDLTKWSYAQLRDMINTSCDINLLNACKDELHRRLKVYHSWRASNTQQTGSDNKRNFRTPNIPADNSSGGAVVHSEEDKEKERYYRVPFLRPSPEQFDKNRGWWYAQFKGQWIVRQLELYPNTAPLLLVAGTDDMEMCELSLEETGLQRKKGAEITEKQFEEAWKKCQENKNTKGEASTL